MTVEETAEALGVSPITIKRDWETAKAWLYLQLGNKDGLEPVSEELRPSRRIGACSGGVLI
jgi:uncharacterized protein YjcR